MGGKGGDSSAQYAQAAYDNAYNAAQSGASYNAVMSQFTGQNEPFLPYAEAGYAAGAGAGGGSHFGGFEFGGGSHMGEFDAGGDAYADAIAQQTADLAAQEEERRRIEGENRRDALYSDYLDAAGSATDYINSQISQELANAQLLGIDYEITDEQKQIRINDYFGSIWGEGQQGELEALMKEWGNPAGFKGFTVVRGSGETLQDAEGGEETVAVSRGIKPTIVSEEEDQLLGGGPSVLGV